MSVLDRAMASDAIARVSPYIESLFSGPAKRTHLHVVVGTRTDDGQVTYLASRSFGERSEWEHAYDDIADGKLAISARTGLSSREVQLMRPELLEEDDVMFWGSVVVGNIVVACSGVQPWFDEAIAYALAYLCRALVQNSLERIKEEARGDTYNS